MSPVRTTLFYAGGEFQFYVSFGDGYREGTQSVEISVTLATSLRFTASRR